MTMKLKITNEDTTRTAKVTLSDSPEITTIQPGKSVDVFIHSTRSITVSEVQPDATAWKDPDPT